MSKHTDTYHKLITAAAACFAEKGFRATSVRDIATRAGISQGAMYTYFKGKDELIEAIVLEEQKSALAAQQAAHEGTCLARLCELTSHCISDVGYPVTHHLWLEIMAESARNPELGQAFINSDSAMRQGIATLIQEGMMAREFRQDIDANEMTLFIFSLIDGLIARKAINAEFSPQQHIETFKTLLSRMLCA